MADNNYVIGRGKLYFDKFFAGTQNKSGERYLGNTPSLTMTSNYTNLDHYSSDEGLRQKDDSVQLQVDRSGTFTCDNISMDNVALVFGTEPQTDTITDASGASETFVAAPGRFYQLGSDAATPDGIGNVLNVVVTDNSGLHAYGNVTFAGGVPTADDTVTINGQAITFKAAAVLDHEVTIGATALITAQHFLAEINKWPDLYDVTASGIENVISLRAITTGTGGNAISMAESADNVTVDGATLSGGAASGIINAAGNFEVDLVRGRVHILDSPLDIDTGDTIEIQYDNSLSSVSSVIDDETQVEGALRFVADNPRGKNKDYFWPRAKLTPSGEYALKGETWQTMTFNFEVLQPTDGSRRVYVRERASA